MRVSRLRLRFRTHNKQSRGVPLSLNSPDARRRRVAEDIAYAFRDGVWVASRMAAGAAHDLELPESAWLHELADAAVTSHPNPPFDRPRAFLDWMVETLTYGATDPAIDGWIADQPQTSSDAWGGPSLRRPPAEMGERRWPVPSIASPSELADSLRLDPSELAWYADAKSLERSVRDENLRHYSYYWLPKRRGSSRLVEAPKQNLKYLQRRILREILNHIPPHDSAHGFRRGHSIQSYAAPHTGRDLVIRLDLQDFFTTVRAGRVFGTFYAAGYPYEVAYLLTALTTNAVPIDVLRRRPHRADPGVASNDALLRGPHLPQGSPTSPALANLAAFGLDRRLTALAEQFDARYTRYADDIAVSGDEEFARVAHRFLRLVDGIVRDEGFRLRASKTSKRARHQRQVLTGMVVNQQLNVHRRDYDQLRAILHDARVNGVKAANRSGHPHFRSHLEGRISFVQATNPQRARKLWVAFDQIDWLDSNAS